MPEPQLLHERLDAIAAALKATGHGLGVLALGSVGRETARLDRWSDLDFFLIVERGTKTLYLDNPRWLAAASPVAWSFRNTADGYKVLFADGVFCEMAWFEPHELAFIPYSPGRWVWRHESLDEALAVSVQPNVPPAPVSAEPVLGELLSCLYVGLGRWHRGERLSAWRFIQTYCLDRFLELVDLKFPSTAPFADVYTRDRRWEARHPELSLLLPALLTGYERTPEAALSLLAWCEQHFEVNAAIAREIRVLAEGGSHA